jgi:hypothetical protein
MPARPGDAELLRPKYAGRSIIEVLWEDLISCIDKLMESDDYYDDDSGWDRTRTEGRAEGVAWSLAVMIQSPRTPDINLIKAEAMERWKAEQE